MNDPIQKYCEEQGFELAQRIDYKTALIIKPKPSWCPDWLYKKIIRECVEIVNVAY